MRWRLIRLFILISTLLMYSCIPSAGLTLTRFPNVATYISVLDYMEHD